MGADSEDIEEADTAPPPPGTNKVEITVAGHTVVIESADPLADVVGYAMTIFEETAGTATRIPVGFDAGGGQFERAEPYVEPSGMERWEDDDVRRMDRLQRLGAKDGTTRRLANPDQAGGHRTRLRPVQMDRGRAAVPRAGD